MWLLLDIGNSNTHLGLADAVGVVRQSNLPTNDWFTKRAAAQLARFVGRHRLDGVALCSVVPAVIPRVVKTARCRWQLTPFELSAKTVATVSIDYPKPATIGPDRLANAAALRHCHGAPAVAVDFGTAVTFDVVDRHGRYIGGVIAPGLSAMTSYLHEKTALLPAIRIREVDSVIGRSTIEAMQIGAVHGYRGLIRELILEIKKELGVRRLPVIATGGYARLLAARLPEITAVEPLLTLEGLRLELACHLKHTVSDLTMLRHESHYRPV
jgi:type III pantothenate kinase